ncbi:MAG: hypothetical protein ACOYKA_06060, partial [Legionellaceae bacterium]
MPGNLNVLLTPEGMLQAFLQDVVEFEPRDPRSKKTKATGLNHLKEDLTQCFFDSSESPTSEALASHPYLRAYPQLREALNVIYALESTDEASLKLAEERLKALPLDWRADESSQQFERINGHLGYFESSLEISELFKALARLCRTSMVVVEGNEAVTDQEIYDTAYTLMVLCLQQEQAIPKLGDLIKSVNKLIDQRDKKTKRPMQEMFLHLQLPKANEVNDRKGWLELIKKEGERALPFFTQASKIEEKTANKKAPKTIHAAEAAAALVKYARGEEDPEFAALCYVYDKAGHDEHAENGGTLEKVFNLSLEYMKTGWPKKTRDSLPNLVIKGKPFIQEGKDVGAGYYWVKLPPTDKRALILGKITHCCQSMGGDSEECVKDGVSLEDNGFYVLLKHQRGDASKPLHDDGSINYDNFQIIGQSYAWRSTEGDVCLDSIECLRNSIPVDVLKQMLTQFAQEVLASDSSMTRVHLGQGGG